ncbi:MAG: ATP synthase F1 subunit gamma [Bacteroidales bacterium]|nr:ATP synthase F1 subunit gamma [Bacteroidales bacterium]
MASLREIKGRIASVGSTLKITSAMKLVASAKLRKAQQAIGNMLPYENHLHRILLDLMSSGLSLADSAAGLRPYSAAAKREWTRPGPDSRSALSVGSALLQSRPVGKVAIVAFSSNSSLCGAFNANAIREALSVINEYRAAGLQDGDITVYSIGRKMQEAMKKAGFVSPADFTRMAEHPGYDAASTLAQELLDGFVEGRFDKVELVYNHFKSTSSQVVTRNTYLPLDLSEGPQTLNAGKRPEVFEEEMPSPKNPEDLIVEPSPEELIGILLPKVVRLRIFTTLLDSNAAEHAARTVAMQTATDNGNDLLQELTLEYNKSRQQKITSEILDIVGGSLQ